MTGLLLALVLSYLAGSFPTSIIVGKLFFHKDPRQHGSGNAGGTNSFRVFGWKAGVGVILFDVGKGVLATLLISRLGLQIDFLSQPAVMLSCGLAAVVGHIWTVFAGFRGGKGVGTAAGMLVSLYPLAFAGAASVFLLVIFITGIVAAGSIAAAVSFPFIVMLLSAAGGGVPPVLFWASIPMALLIVFTHRKNIGRMIRGEENSFEKLALLRRLWKRLSGKEST